MASPAAVSARTRVCHRSVVSERSTELVITAGLSSASDGVTRASSPHDEDSEERFVLQQESAFIFLIRLFGKKSHKE